MHFAGCGSDKDRPNMVVSCHIALCLTTRANLLANLLISSSLGYFRLTELIWLTERAYPELGAPILES